MSKAGVKLWVYGVAGLLFLGFGIFWSIQMPPFLGKICQTQPCNTQWALSGILAVIGLLLIIVGATAKARAKQQTVVIKLNREAEKDAAALQHIQKAVAKGESAEEKIEPAKKERLVVPPEVFASLTQDEVKYKPQRKSVVKKKKKR